MTQKIHDTEDATSPKWQSSGVRSCDDIPFSDSAKTAKEFYNKDSLKYFECLGFRICMNKNDSEKIEKHLIKLISESDISNSCDRIFTDFYEYNKNTSIQWPPPKQIPSKFLKGYNLHGRIKKIDEYYFAGKFNGIPTPQIWTRDKIEKQRELVRDNKNLKHYGEASLIFYEVLKHFNISGSTGLVIGSLSPWVEVILIEKGKAKKILTDEYYPIISEHPQIDYIHPVDLAKRFSEIKSKYNFDFVASYSSLEHAGLGRFGDHLDPDGDLKEMQKVYCLLKEGGLVFLGTEYGKDALFWNAHRIYGKWRAPMMFANFEFLGFYTTDQLRIPSIS